MSSRCDTFRSGREPATPLSRFQGAASLVPLPVLLLAVAGMLLVSPAYCGSEDEAWGGHGSTHGRGLIPLPFEVARVEPRMLAPIVPLPERFDWREQGKVTSIRDQGGCGACYAFAMLADFESKLLIGGDAAYDFSENNVKECSYGTYKCAGGHSWIVANYLASYGTVLETCDPYVAYPSTCKSSCPRVKTLLEFQQLSEKWIPPPEVLKTYILEYGPVYVAIYAGNGDPWYAEFDNYRGDYTLFYNGSEEVNHAVLIVGWDDNLTHASGQGAWIAKNSWGLSWGGTCGYGIQKGYFTIAYGSANIGHYTAFIKDWQDHDPDGMLLFYDEAGGYYAGLGAGTTAWGMCKFTPSDDVLLQRVELWSRDEITDVDVYVYDSFDGGSLAGLLASTLDASFELPGYHSVKLASPLMVSGGNDIYVVARITCATYNFPLPVDDRGPKESGKCFVSIDGTSWSECPGGDLGIRARVTKYKVNRAWRVPGDAATITAAVGLASDGDTVVVGPGRYTESGIAIAKDIILWGQAGAESTLVDGDGAASSLVTFTGVQSGAALRGFTLRGASRSGVGGAVEVINSEVEIDNCVLAENSTPLGGALFASSSSVEMSGCTVAYNSGYAGVYFEGEGASSLGRCIVAFTGSGPGMRCGAGARVTVACSDVFGNDGGDAVCGTDGGGNFSDDPLFCTRGASDCWLRETSPCLDGYGCGQIGALGRGCPAEDLAGLASFSAAAGEGQDTLTWVLPDDPNVVGAFIAYSSTANPDQPGDGSPVENGSGGYFPGETGSSGTFVHRDLVNGVPHYYTAFTYNSTPDFSSGVSASATPRDLTPPEIAISVFQNPYITNHLDVFVNASEALVDTSVKATVADQEIQMSAVGPEKTTYRGDYDLCCQGSLTIEARARDTALNAGSETRSYGVAHLASVSGGRASSLDGRLELSAGETCLGRDTYVLVGECLGVAGVVGACYEISPAWAGLTDLAEVAIRYDPGTNKPEGLVVARFEDVGIVPLDSYLDRAGMRVVAYVDRFGRYGLTRAEGHENKPYARGLEVWQQGPNPFQTTTVVGYFTPNRSRIRAEVVGVDGRLIDTIIDDCVASGEHRVEWDGRDAAGDEMVGGIYFLRLTSDSGVRNLKIVLIR